MAASSGPSYGDLSRYLSEGPTHRRTEAVADALQEAILDGTMPPNAWLREDELAKVLKVGRTPIREALQRLADEGLAVKTANHGSVISQLSLGDLLARCVIREDLEGLAARLAAKHCPPRLVKRLDDVGQLMRKAAKKIDVARLSRLNLEWRRALREGTSNYLLRPASCVRSSKRGAEYPSSIPGHPGRAEEVVHEHDAVVRAIEARDGESAERAGPGAHAPGTGGPRRGAAEHVSSSGGGESKPKH